MVSTETEGGTATKRPRFQRRKTGEKPLKNVQIPPAK